MYENWVTELPGKEIDIFTMPVAPLDVNAVFIVNRTSGEAILVDPGGEPDELIGFAKYRGLKLKRVILTHAHFDHVTAVDDLVRFIEESDAEAEAKLAMHPDDQFILEHISESAGRFGIGVAELKCKPGLELVDQMTMDSWGIRIQVIHTPGHSPGSCCFYLPQEGILISGDTLFAGGIGRTDLRGGSFEQLNHSIKNKLYQLDGETRVIPGHGELTTIGDEKKSNPYIRG